MNESSLAVRAVIWAIQSFDLFSRALTGRPMPFTKFVLGAYLPTLAQILNHSPRNFQKSLYLIILDI